MKYGIHTFTRGPTREPEPIARLASTCDRLGFDYYGVSDHVVVSAQIDSKYPYSEDGSWPISLKNSARIRVCSWLSSRFFGDDPYPFRTSA